MLKVGEDLPDFEVLDQDGKPFLKKDILGNYSVLFFYPKDNTPGCTKEACDFSATLGEFEQMGVKVYGMSKDSPASHRKFIESKKLNFVLLSDESTKALTAFGVIAEKSMFGKKYMGIVRSTFLIDPNGKILHVFPKVAVLGHVKKVIEIFKKQTEKG